MLLLIFSITLLAGVLLSQRFNRTVLSSTVLFLAVGFGIGPSGLGWVQIAADDPLVSRLSDVALVLIVFADALALGWNDLTTVWRLPGRALLFGLPLTIAGIALAAHAVLALPWLDAWLIGAILSPTDPVFASAIVGRREIPARLRHLLNVESGLNDGLALPVVIVLVSLVSAETWTASAMLAETLGGVALGAVVGYAGARARGLRLADVSAAAAPGHALALVLIAYAASRVLHVNPYLAAFSTGLVAASTCPSMVAEFKTFGEHLGQLMKLAAVFVFAVMFSGIERMPSVATVVFVMLVLTVVRLVALEVALLGSGLPWRERLTATWFGPKGFASVVYGLLLLASGAPRARGLFELVALVIVTSMVLHSSTDVPVARYFESRGETPRAA